MVARYSEQLAFKLVQITTNLTQISHCVSKIHFWKKWTYYD